MEALGTRAPKNGLRAFGVSGKELSVSTLAERVASAAPVKKPTLEAWLKSLEPADQELIKEAARTWARSTLERFIREEGVSVSDVSLERWIATL